MGIENERERTSSKKDCKHNVLHKPILLKMEKEIINLRKKWFLLQIRKIRNKKDKDKKIILWEVKSFQAIEINKREEEFKDV